MDTAGSMGYLAYSAGVCIEHKFVIYGIEDNGSCPYFPQKG